MASISTFLYNIIISPIELIVEFVFELMYRVLGQHQKNQGLAIIGVSLAISFFTLPLYQKADLVQQKQRDIQNYLSKWTKHIKKSFKGEEQYMILQTYYKQNAYNPLHALKGSVSLLLQIPFFIAAYHFLSNLELLNGASFFLIKDLGRADNLFSIKKFNIKVLPILMTLINIISSAIYLKGFPIKSKIQTYSMAFIFLVLLYKSPSGLVIYWTFNNLFSLVKNIFYKLKSPKKVLIYISAITGTFLPLILIISGILNTKKKIIAVIIFGLILYLPLILSLLNKSKIKKLFNFSFNKEENNSNCIFFSQILIVLLLGLFIPSTVISSSPAEFIDINDYKNPLNYLLYTFSYSLGFFLLWPTIVYSMGKDKIKKNIIRYFLCIFHNRLS